VCILTAALCLRNLAHGNSERHRSIVVEIERVKGVVQIDADRIFDVQRSGDAHKVLGEIGEDAPVVSLVGIGQS